MPLYGHAFFLRIRFFIGTFPNNHHRVILPSKYTFPISFCCPISYIKVFNSNNINGFSFQTFEVEIPEICSQDAIKSKNDEVVATILSRDGLGFDNVKKAEENDYSIVTRFTYRNFTYFTGGDIEMGTPFFFHEVIFVLFAIYCSCQYNSVETPETKLSSFLSLRIKYNKR